MLQEQRNHFKIGQAMKTFSPASLANVLSTITSCKTFLWLADASWFLKLMVESFQFLKPLLVKARLLLLRSILLDFSADTHTYIAKYNVIWVVGLVMQPGSHGKPGCLARPLYYWRLTFRLYGLCNNQSNLSNLKHNITVKMSFYQLLREER